MSRRDEVLEAATAVLVEGGTHGLTHRRVDARAGAPPGTTSNYFPNWLALLRGILDVVAKADREFVSRPVEYDGVTEPEDVLYTWLRRRLEHMVGPDRLQALTWYRLAVDGSTVPEVRVALAAGRKLLFEDCKSIAARCGSLDPARHGAWLRSFIGGAVPTRYIFPNADYDLDLVVRPMARGLMSVIRRDWEENDGSA